MVSPAETDAVIVGTVPPIQYDLLPPLTGASVTGQLQFGAVTTRTFSQPLPSVTLNVILVPEITFVIDHTLPPVLVTVPEVLVTVPELTFIISEYVERSGEQVGGDVIIMNGRIFTKFVMTGDTETHPVTLVTITSIIWPLVSELVVYVEDPPF